MSTTRLFMALLHEDPLRLGRRGRTSRDRPQEPHYRDEVEVWPSIRPGVIGYSRRILGPFTVASPRRFQRGINVLSASLGLVHASLLVSSPGSRLASVIMSISTFVRDSIMAAFQSGASAKLCFPVLVLKASEFRKSPF